MLVAGTASLLFAGCAGYWRDRGRDAGDMVTASVGFGLGAGVQAGPAATGVGLQFTLVGIDDGSFIDLEGHLPPVVEGGMIVASVKVGGENDDPRHRGKGYMVPTFAGVIPGMWVDDAKAAPHYWTKVDVSVSLGVGGRLGFNPGELVDFLLGFAGLDVYGDDLSTRSATAAAGH